MALREKLDEGDLALVDVLEDPILCVEFMRNTRDGSINRALWPARKFEYRHYQRALMSDKSEKIVLLGGRSIGKCQPVGSRIYTTKGFEKIFHLRSNPVFEVYCLDSEGKQTTARAVLQKDKWTKTYKVTTESGYSVVGSANHPILTDKGYVMISDLLVNDMAAVPTLLPWTSLQKLWRWHELRLFGYIFLNKTWRIDKELYPRFKQIRTELEYIAKLADMKFMSNTDAVFLIRKRGSVRGIINQLAHEFRFTGLFRNVGFGTIGRWVPGMLKAECLEHIKVFLEAMFAQFATLKRRSVEVDCLDDDAANDVRELLLRFGIESYIDGTVLQLRDERAIYRFYTTFTLPGVGVESINPPPQSLDINETMRYDRITSIELHKERELTYALYVYDHHNYISDYIHVHNSLVLEDKFIYQTLNQDIEFPETKESLLATANKAQLDLVLGRLITRFMASPLLKEALKNRVNRSLGVLDFRFEDVQFLLRARIAGSTGDTNLVGLHVPRIAIDEAQLFNIGSWNQLSPALNRWEQKTQLFITGVNQ